ncbi:hypothetical protein MASR2M15_28380 [Anaerolineales bacterium]
MRRQLIIAFLLIITIATAISLVLAGQTATNEFALLVTDNTQAQALRDIDIMAAAYVEYGSWESAQYALQETISWVQPIYEYMLHPEDADLQKFAQSLEPRDLQEQLSEPIFSLALQLLLLEQRLIIITDQNKVVLDSNNLISGQQLLNVDTSKAIPILVRGEKVGALLLSYQTGLLSKGQDFFLQRVLRGLVVGALFSAGIAALIAVFFADYLVRPIHHLHKAIKEIIKGDWGYQIEVPETTEEIMALSKGFNDMSMQLKNQRDLRTRLVHDVSHELNTPLTLMQFEIQGLKDKLQSPEETARNLEAEVKEVAALVQDLVYLASYDKERTSVKKFQSINPIAEKCFRRFEVAIDKQLSLSFELKDPLPDTNINAEKTQRAISNLLSNAIRHTPQHGKVSLQTFSDGQFVKVRVSDSGDGIPAEHLTHIFEKFYRIDSSRHRNFGGRGLGLSIVRQIMDEHGGSVDVQSEIGKGSQFTLSFPIFKPGKEES